MAIWSASEVTVQRWMGLRKTIEWKKQMWNSPWPQSSFSKGAQLAVLQSACHAMNGSCTYCWQATVPDIVSLTWNIQWGRWVHKQIRCSWSHEQSQVTAMTQRCRSWRERNEGNSAALGSSANVTRCLICLMHLCSSHFWSVSAIKFLLQFST